MNIFSGYVGFSEISKRTGLMPSEQLSGVKEKGDDSIAINNLLRDMVFLVEQLSAKLNMKVEVPVPNSALLRTDVLEPKSSTKLPLNGVAFNNKLVNRYELGHVFVGRADSVRTTPDSLVKGTSATVGIPPADIFSDFYQKKEGNCVTVSAIKAAMLKFGHNPHGIYKKIEATDNGFNVVMRDSFKLHVTHDELQQAGDAANFWAKRPNDVLVNARFLYAVSVKREQLEAKSEGKEGFAAAIKELNDGEYPGEALRRLGLRGHTVSASLEELLAGGTGTVADDKHSVLVADGYVDLSGHKVLFADSGYANAGNWMLKLI